MSYIAKTIIFGSLTAFAVETSVLAHNGKIGHGLPSAVQIAPTLASSGAASMLVVSGALHHFPERDHRGSLPRRGRQQGPQERWATGAVVAGDHFDLALPHQRPLPLLRQ